MSLDPGEYQVMYQVEDTMWWYRGMARITQAVLDRYYANESELRILDAGCGTCGAIAYLTRYGKVTGIDFSPYALQYGRQRGKGALARGSVDVLPFAQSSFDLVTSFDVLCVNTVDDDRALREFGRVLVSGGRVVLRLPAYNWLHGAHDVAVNIAHRYTTHDIAARIRRVGLVVDHLSYANMWLFPLALAKRWGEQLLPEQQRSDLTLSFGPLDPVFAGVLASEAPLVAARGLPLGLTVVAVAHKR
jgi:SAM-dependent methyltransferase